MLYYSIILSLSDEQYLIYYFNTSWTWRRVTVEKNLYLNTWKLNDKKSTNIKVMNTGLL